MADKTSPLFERGTRTIEAIGAAPFPPGRKRFPALPPEQADDVQRKVVKLCFGDTWGREGSYVDLKTRRLLTIATMVAQGKERQLRNQLGGALDQGISAEEFVETVVHLIAYVGFPAGLTGLEILNDVIAARK